MTQDTGPRRGMHLLLSVNAAWNLLNFRRPLIAALLADGHRVTVLAPPDGAEAELQAMGCAFVPLKMDRKGLSPARDFALMARFARQFRRLRPDAVLSFTIKNNIFGAMAARITGTPFIPNVTGLGTAFLGATALQTLVERLYSTAFARVPVVFFQNGDDRDLFADRRLIRPGQARVLPGSGLDLNLFDPAPLPGAGPTFLMIARVLRDKGAVEYADAARMLAQSHPGAKVQLLGPLGAENRTALSAEDVAGWALDYLGETADVRPYIAAADCLVLPSYREGTPRTLLEGAAMARPLIATDVPGCRSVVEDGVTGLLCAPRDAASLHAAMARMADMSAAARAAMGQAGRAKMEDEYDVAHVIAAYRVALGEIGAP